MTIFTHRTWKFLFHLAFTFLFFLYFSFFLFFYSVLQFRLPKCVRTHSLNATHSSVQPMELCSSTKLIFCCCSWKIKLIMAIIDSVQKRAHFYKRQMQNWLVWLLLFVSIDSPQLDSYMGDWRNGGYYMCCDFHSPWSHSDKAEGQKYAPF